MVVTAYALAFGSLLPLGGARGPGSLRGGARVRAEEVERAGLVPITLQESRHTGAFLGVCAGRPAVGDTAFLVSDQRTYCLRRANHQDTVTAFHLAGCKCWSVERDQGVRVGWVRPVRALAKPSVGYEPDVIGNC